MRADKISASPQKLQQLRMVVCFLVHIPIHEQRKKPTRLAGERTGEQYRSCKCGIFRRSVGGIMAAAETVQVVRLADMHDAARLKRIQCGVLELVVGRVSTSG